MFTAIACAIIQFFAPENLSSTTEAKKLYTIHVSDHKVITATEKFVAQAAEKINLAEKPETVPAKPVATVSKIQSVSTIAGSIFMIVFLINILVISFDFPGLKALALGLTGICVILLLLYLEWFPLVGKFLGQVSKTLHASWGFYALISGIIFIMMFFGVVYNRLFNQWIVEANRLLHRHGFFGEFTEYPVVDLQMDKEIDDIFEYALLFSGTLTFRPNPTTPPIRLENIPFIKYKERKIRSIIRKVTVKED